MAIGSDIPDEAMQQQKGISRGRLRVTVISAADYFFPHLLGAFVRQHPGVGIELTAVNRAELLRRIANNDTDLGVMVRIPEDPDLQAVSFAPHPYVIVAPPSHPLASRDSIPVSLIAGAQTVICNNSVALHIAEAFGVPCIALTGPSDPVRWGTYRSHSRTVSRSRGLPCHPCGEKRCVLPNTPCIERISLADVLQALEEIGSAPTAIRPHVVSRT